MVELDASVSGWRERLQAYGLAPGREVTVVQHTPVTVVRVEHIDLAFESRIAHGILVYASVAERTAGLALGGESGLAPRPARANTG